VLTREIGLDGAARTVDAAMEATGGNPFLLAELALAWKADGGSGRLTSTLELRRSVAQRIAGARARPTPR
jgi:hypothetical protein